MTPEERLAAGLWDFPPPSVLYSSAPSAARLATEAGGLRDLPQPSLLQPFLPPSEADSGAEEAPGARLPAPPAPPPWEPPPSPRPPLCKAAVTREAAAPVLTQWVLSPPAEAPEASRDEAATAATSSKATPVPTDTPSRSSTPARSRGPSQAASAQGSEAFFEPEGPPPPPPVVAILCDGSRLESGPLDDLKGFRQRAQNSFFQALLDPETDQFKDESGALVIRDVPLAVVKDVWRYLRLGLQPGLSTLSEYCEWRKICDFFALSVHDPLADVRRFTEASALATSRYLMVKTASSAGLSPLCYALRCGSECCPEAIPLGFDQVCVEGTLHLQAEQCEPPLEVKLDPSAGSLSVRFMREAVWQHVGGHACMRHKKMLALKARFPKPQPPVGPYRDPAPGEMQVTELYIHMSPLGKSSPSTSSGGDVCIAAWPAFWCLVRIVRRRALDHTVWSSWNATFEILPGAVCVMADGLIVQVVAQPRSLHKCYLRVCGADWEHEVCAKLLAPTPFYTRHMQSGKGGKSKASYAGKGFGPTLEGGQKYYKYQVPSYDTPTPEDAARNVKGRCMQQVWIIRRRNRPGSKPHMVVLLHAIDGRVAVAQLSGDTGQAGCIPPLYGVGGIAGRSSKTCAIWGAKAWHWELQGIVGAIGQYSRSYDVPKCHEVMAIALQDASRILVLHRPRSHGSPQLWTINQPEAFQGGMWSPSFFRVHGKGRGKGKGPFFNGNSIGYPVGGSWMDDRWGTTNERQVVLPADIVAGLDADEGSDVANCPLFVPLWKTGEVSAAPEVEVLRLDGKSEICNVPANGKGGSLGYSKPQASWHITGRLHYRCREPVLPH